MLTLLPLRGAYEQLLVGKPRLRRRLPMRGIMVKEVRGVRILSGEIRGTFAQKIVKTAL